MKTTLAETIGRLDPTAVTRPIKRVDRTLKLTLAWLFAGWWSNKSDRTPEAVLVNVWPSVPAFGWAEISNDAVAPFARFPTVHNPLVNVPWPGVAPKNVRPAGKVSVSKTPVVSLGPLFRIVTV